MATTPPSSPQGALVIDASIVVAITAKEKNTEPLALAELGDYSRLGYAFYAPGVLVAEALYVLCGKLEQGTLDVTSHTQAIAELEKLMSGILPPPGRKVLISRAFSAGKPDNFSFR